MDSLFDYYSPTNFFCLPIKEFSFPWCLRTCRVAHHSSCRPQIANLCWSQMNLSLLEKYLAVYIFQISNTLSFGPLHFLWLRSYSNLIIFNLRQEGRRQGTTVKRDVEGAQPLRKTGYNNNCLEPAKPKMAAIMVQAWSSYWPLAHCR